MKIGQRHGERHRREGCVLFSPLNEHILLQPSEKKIIRITSVKKYLKILEIEVEIAEKSKEKRVKYSPVSIPTCELL